MQTEQSISQIIMINDHQTTSQTDKSLSYPLLLVLCYLQHVWVYWYYSKSKSNSCDTKSNTRQPQMTAWIGHILQNEIQEKQESYKNEGLKIQDTHTFR